MEICVGLRIIIRLLGPDVASSDTLEHTMRTPTIFSGKYLYQLGTIAYDGVRLLASPRLELLV